MVDELEDMKQDISDSINVATALDIAGIVLGFKEQVNDYKLILNKKIKKDSDIANNISILAAKKQEVLNHIDNEANIKSQNFSKAEQERIAKELQENAEKDIKRNEEKEKVEAIENKYMPIIGSTRTIQELDNIKADIENELNSIVVVFPELIIIKGEILSKLKKICVVS